MNTIYKKDNLVIGDNTDVFGFSQSIINQKLNLKNKKALILGAGGVVPSIITALKIYLLVTFTLKIEHMKNLYS